MQPQRTATPNATASRARRLLCCAALVSTLIPGAALGAGPKAETLFPEETVGYVALMNRPDFEERWGRTQLGKLADDPAMKPFADSLREQFNDRFGRLDDRLGVMVDDFTEVATGEAAIGLVAAGEGRERASVALVIDVAGKLDDARALLNKIELELTERGANSVGETEGGSVKVYTVPEKTDADTGEVTPSKTAVCALFADRLIACDNAVLARGLVEKLRGGDAAALADRPAYRETLRRAREAARGLAPTVEWYMSPFEYEIASRDADRLGPSDEEDTLSILRRQGFTAVEGIGGQLTVAADPRRDFVHSTLIYAPPKEGAEGKKAAEKYDLAMRMFELPNSNGPFQVEPWAPRDVASYKALSIDIENVFEYVGTLFDAFAGYENAFETTLEGFEKDPFGPKINLREQIIAHLGTRVTVLNDYTLPITAECERYLIVIDVKNPVALREPLDKLLESDGAIAKELRGIPYWEIVPEEEAFETPDLDQGLLPLDGGDLFEEETEERVLQRAAVCLHEDRLTIASDVDFLNKALFGVEDREALEGCADLRAAVEALGELAQGPRCAWTFSRIDESLRPSYELLREGKMPESKTFFGRTVNRLLTTPDEAEAGANREQKIDGKELPSFELVRRYFGPSARVIRSEGDGWLIVGVALSKANE